MLLALLLYSHSSSIAYLFSYIIIYQAKFKDTDVAQTATNTMHVYNNFKMLERITTI
jgi:hypothetical protein